MAWFKVDDGFWAHPKTVGLSEAAVALWLRAGTWSAQQLTDGFIPSRMLPLLQSVPEVAAELVAADLWEVLPDGWGFHDWDWFQPTRDEVEKLRQKRAEAGRRGGKRSGETRRGSKNEASASRGLEAKPNPVPSRPVPTPVNSPSNGPVLLTDAREQKQDGTILQFLDLDSNEVRRACKAALGTDQITDQQVLVLWWAISPNAAGPIRNPTAFLCQAIRQTPGNAEKALMEAS